MPSLSEGLPRETVARAREIATHSSEGEIPEQALEAYVKAAEEVGIPRDALLQALRERRSDLGISPAVGQVLFAPSLDGFWYPARIASVEQHTAVVQFVQGDSHTCALADLRPLALVPGRKLQVNWPHWGWWTVTVESYDPKTGALSVTDGWSSMKTEFGKTRLSAKIASPLSKEERRPVAVSRGALVRCSLLAGTVGVAAGAVLDRLLPWLFAFLR